MKNKERSDATTSGQVGPKHRVWGGPQQAVSDDFAARQNG